MRFIQCLVAIAVLFVGTQAFGASEPRNFYGRIRANDAPVAGRFTVGAYFLDTLDVVLPRPVPGRMLLLRFHDSNGKDAFVVPSDFEVRGRQRTTHRSGIAPVTGKRLGGHLKKDESRWAIWWVPGGPDTLVWNDPADLSLHYGFSDTEFVPLRGGDLTEILRIIPWADVIRAGQDSTYVDDGTYLDAAAFDQPPVAKIRRNPPYPSSSKMYDFQGSLFVAVQVDANGQVDDAYVLQSNAVHELNVAALSAVMDWVFKPGLKSGKPVAGDFVIPIQFDLGSVK
ncbi:MAG TPA: energy transducer TonB [Candidatus Eisenbacteria bacterium]|nr:energy transducer TonB [Candidatus Eisenbacteria bacterium]